MNTSLRHLFHPLLFFRAFSLRISCCTAASTVSIPQNTQHDRNTYRTPCVIFFSSDNLVSLRISSTPYRLRYILFQLDLFTLQIFHLFCKFFNLCSHCPTTLFYLEETSGLIFVPGSLPVPTCQLPVTTFKHYPRILLFPYYIIHNRL